MKSISQLRINKIFEVNGPHWLSDFLNKTSKFMEVWMKKGNHKIKVDEKGITGTKEEIVMKLQQMNGEFNKNATFKKVFPRTGKYLAGEYKQIQPDGIDGTAWETGDMKLYVYTPEINYEGENYPVACGIVGAKKLQVENDFLHVHCFEMSRIVENLNAVNFLFESFVDTIKKSYTGITISAKNPSIYGKFQYHGNKFEDSGKENILKMTLKASSNDEESQSSSDSHSS